MGIFMNLFQEIQLVTVLNLVAFPAAVKAVFLAAFSYVTKGRTAASTAGLFTAEPDHCSQNLIALFVKLEFLEGHGLGKPVEF